METKIQRLQEEVARLRDEPGSSQWNRMMMLAALTPVAGPGVEVTLADNPQMKPDMSIPGLSYPGIIHDADILRVVNELFAAKAEAVAIDKQRVGPGTPVRCIGPLINVNQVACAPPYKIDAIGDPETLQHAFDLPGGVAAELKSVGCVVTVEHRSMMLLPAFDGAVDFKFSHTVRSSGKGDDGL
jgi:uncharacterized protein YlxW (UPF0749 family)